MKLYLYIAGIVALVGIGAITGWKIKPEATPAPILKSVYVKDIEREIVVYDDHHGMINKVYVKEENPNLLHNPDGYTTYKRYSASVFCSEDNGPDAMEANIYFWSDPNYKPIFEDSTGRVTWKSGHTITTKIVERDTVIIKGQQSNVPPRFGVSAGLGYIDSPCWKVGGTYRIGDLFGLLNIETELFYGKKLP